MRTAIDTSVISAIWTYQPGGPAAAAAVATAANQSELVVCAAVYAELMAHPGVTAQFVERFFPLAQIDVDYALNHAVWHEAGLRFRAYAERRRRAKSHAPRRLLADFVIGAHALLSASQLITLNERDFQLDFPELKLVSAR